MHRRSFMARVAALPLACSRRPAPLPEDPLARAVSVLTGLALPDGRIPSSTYGFMRDGHRAGVAVVAAAGTNR